jgi:hypothetical protein
MRSGSERSFDDIGGSFLGDRKPELLLRALGYHRWPPGF